MDKWVLSLFYADDSLISYYGLVDTLLPVNQKRSQEFVCRGVHYFLSMWEGGSSTIRAPIHLETIYFIDPRGGLNLPASAVHSQLNQNEKQG